MQHRTTEEKGSFLDATDVETELTELLEIPFSVTIHPLCVFFHFCSHLWTQALVSNLVAFVFATKSTDDII